MLLLFVCVLVLVILIGNFSVYVCVDKVCVMFV